MCLETQDATKTRVSVESLPSEKHLRYSAQCFKDRVEIDDVFYSTDKQRQSQTTMNCLVRSQRVPSLRRSTVKQILFGLLACVRAAADAMVHLSMTIQVRHVPVGSATAGDGAMEWLLQGMLASPFPPVIHARELKQRKPNG